MGLVLGAVQGRQPATGIVIRGPEGRRTKVKLTAKLNGRASDTLAALKRIQAGGQAPVLTLNEHCWVCEFRQPLPCRGGSARTTSACCGS